MIKERTFVADVVADLRPVLRRHVGDDIEVFANRHGEVAAEVEGPDLPVLVMQVQRVGQEFVIRLYMPRMLVYVNEDMEIIGGACQSWSEVYRHVFDTYDAKTAYLEDGNG